MRRRASQKPSGASTVLSSFVLIRNRSQPVLGSALVHSSATPSEPSGYTLPEAEGP